MTTSSGSFLSLLSHKSNWCRCGAGTSCAWVGADVRSISTDCRLNASDCISGSVNVQSVLSRGSGLNGNAGTISVQEELVNSSSGRPSISTFWRVRFVGCAGANEVNFRFAHRCGARCWVEGGGSKGLKELKELNKLLCC